MKCAVAVVTFVFCLLLLPALYYSKDDNKAVSDTHNKVAQRLLRHKRQEDEKDEERKKVAEQRKAAFLERQKAREKGKADPMDKSKDSDRIEAEKRAKAKAEAKKKANAPTTTLPPSMVPSTTTEDPNTKRGNADERTDAALSSVKNMIIDDEPMETGEAGPCDNCEITGISTVERIGRATAIDIDDDQKRVKVYLGLRFLNATCNCTFDYASGTLWASVQKAVVYLDVLVNFAKDDTEVKNVTMKYPGKLSLTFSGSNILGWIYGAFVSLFNSKILSILQQKLIEEIPKLVHENKEHLVHIGMI